MTVGVTVKVTRTGVGAVLVSVPEMSPDPFSGIPVTLVVSSRVQVNVVPGRLPERTIGMIEPPEQTLCEAGVAEPVGDGFTSTVGVNFVPTQPFAVGATVKVTFTGAFVVFVSVPEISPEPLSAMPVTTAPLSRVQVNVAPGIPLESAIVLIGLPEQIVCVVGVAKPVTKGLTVMVAVKGVPEHPLAVGVIVNVTGTGARPIFDKVPETLPVPLAAMPVTVPVLSRVQLNVVPETGPLIVKNAG